MPPLIWLNAAVRGRLCAGAAVVRGIGKGAACLQAAQRCMTSPHCGEGCLPGGACRWRSLSGSRHEGNGAVPCCTRKPAEAWLLLERPGVQQGSPILMRWTDCMQSAAALSSSGSRWGLCSACACASGAMCQRHQQGPSLQATPGLWALPSPAAHKIKPAGIGILIEEAHQEATT